MKHLLLLNIFVLFGFELVLSQNVDMDGDLLVGGGDITFVNDITGPSPKVIPMENSQGAFIIRTLGNPGNTFYLGRDHYLGLGTETPYSNLHVKQDSTPIHSADDIVAPAGITIESSIEKKATMFVDNGGDLSFAFDSIQRCYISSNDGDYHNTSDRRLKKDISTLKSGVLNKICSLTPYSYRFLRSTEESKTLGFIAQEVQEIFPEIVDEKNGFLALSYKDFSVLAIKAIQEQQMLITKLEERITQLENAEK